MENFWSWTGVPIYIFTFLISIILLSSLEFIKTKEKIIYKIHIAIALVPVFVLLAFRSKLIGSDLSNYSVGYLNFSYMDYSLKGILENISISEPIYAIICIVTGVVSNWNFQAFIFITAAIQFIFLGKTLYKVKIKNINPLISFMFFICFIYIRSFSMVRQSMAVSIMLYAYTFLEEKNYKKYWIYSLIAMGIHYTAFISILIYLWSKENKISILKKISIIGIFCIIIIYGNNILTVLFSYIDFKYSNMSFNGNIGLGNFLSRLPLLIFILYYKNKLIEQFNYINIYINIYYLDIIISQLKYFNVQFERLTMYTFMPMFFIIPTIHRVFRNKYGKIVDIITYILMLIWFIYMLYYFTYISPYNIIPYEFSW